MHRDDLFAVRKNAVPGAPWRGHLHPQHLAGEFLQPRAATRVVAQGGVDGGFQCGVEAGAEGGVGHDYFFSARKLYAKAVLPVSVRRTFTARDGGAEPPWMGLRRVL